jgi:hypothetical protein
MAEASSSGGTKIRFRVPSAILKKNRGGRPSDLQQYDNDLLFHANFRRKPAVIADLVRQQYNLDKDFITPSKVERRLRYLKHNKLGKLPPTNSDIPFVATTKPTCIFLIFFISLKDFF